MPAEENKFGFVLRDAVGVGVFTVFATIFFSIDFRYHAIYGLWCSFLSLAALFHAPAYMFSKATPRKRVHIWSLYFCLLLAVAGWFSDWSYKVAHSTVQNVSAEIGTERQPSTQAKPTIEQQVIYNSQIAAARSWHPPELPLNTPTIAGSYKLVTIKFGGIVQRWPVGSEQKPYTGKTVIFPGGDVFTPYIKDNRCYVKTQTLWGDRMETVEINDESSFKIPPDGDRNFNSNTFEIVDADKLPVFQIRYDRPAVIEIYGIFVAQNGAVTIAFRGGTRGIAAPFVKEDLPQAMKEITGRKVWFKYPSKDHLGQLASQ